MDPRTYSDYFPGRDFSPLFLPWSNSECETDLGQKMLATKLSYGIEKNEKLKANDRDHTKVKPLESRHPNAPSIKFFCMYGHGKGTEVSFPVQQAKCNTHKIVLFSVRIGTVNRRSGDISLSDYHYIGILVVNTGTMTRWRKKTHLHTRRIQIVRLSGPL